MNILFFTEAGTNIGYGHITRCYSLLQAFEQKGFSPQMIINSDVNLTQLINTDAYKIVDWINKTEDIVPILQITDIAIFDSYLAPPETLYRLADFVKTPVFIDDFLRMTYLRGIVLNGAIGAENLNYPANDKVKYLLGASFQPIRAEFWNSPQHLIVSEIQNIFITVGGNDIHDILPLIVGLACKNFPNAIVRIICGKNHNTKRWVEQQQNKNITAHFNISAAEMQYLMKSSDIAISAAGQTLYELAATGLPTIAFSVANNQITNLEGWTQAGFVLNAGICTDSDFLKKLQSSIEKFKSAENRMISSINGQRIISKKGSCNAVNATLSIHCIQHMLLRKANPSDVDEIFNLSNDVAVRENSFNQEKILYSDHVAWFQKKINNPNSLLLVANISNTFAGQIRYEITNECAIISISIDKKFRGIGLGEKLIKESKNNLIAQYPSVKFIIAQIRKENHASVNMFLKAGFNFYKEEEYLEYHLII